MKFTLAQRAYFKTLSVAIKFRRDCMNTNFHVSDVEPRRGGYMVIWLAR